MPIIMKNGRLVTVPSLQSDKKKPVAAPSNIKPETITSEPVVNEDSNESASKYDGMKKAELVKIAEERGLEFPKKAKVADLIDLLEGSDEDNSSDDI